MRKGFLRRFSRTTLTVIVVLGILLVGGRLAMPHYVHKYVNKKLSEIPNYYGHVGDIDIHLIRGAYTIQKLELLKKSGEVRTPFVSASSMDLSMQWKEFFHGSLVGEIEIWDAKLNFVKGPTEEQSQTDIDNHWIQVVKDLFPFKINRFTINAGEARFHDVIANPKVDIAITNMFAVATNLTNARNLNTKLPADFRLRGETIGGGHLALGVRLDPLAEKPTFDLDAEVTKMDLTALNDLLRAYAKVDVKRGTFEVYTEVAAKEGSFEGYVKPLIEDLDVIDIKEDIKNPVKLAWKTVVAGITQLFKNHSKDRLATKVPISGTFDKTDVDIWTTVGNVLRNAFIQAFRPAIDKSIDLEKVEKDTNNGKNPPKEKGKKERRKDDKKHEEKDSSGKAVDSNESYARTSK